MLTTMEKNKRGEGNIRTDFGATDYYKFYRECNQDNHVSAAVFSKIIRDFNSAIIDLIIEENLEYTLPYIGATLAIRCDKRVPRIVNGKLYNTIPVDWVATNKLWDTDLEAREKKLLVRYSNSHSSKYVFRINFKKYEFNVKNKYIYKFKAARDFQRALGARIKDEDKDQYHSYLIF